MALLKCPECSNEVSDKAVSCPKCGYPLQGTPPQAAATQTQPDADTLLKQMLSRGEKIAAIKLYREHNPGTGLVEAKHYVERLEAELPPGTVKKLQPKGCLSLVVFVGLFLSPCAFFTIWRTISALR